MLLVNNATIYYGDYLEDGLSRNYLKMQLKNINGALLVFANSYYLTRDLPVDIAVKVKIKNAIQYTKLCILTNTHIRKYKINHLLCYLLYLPEKIYISFFYDKKRCSKNGMCFGGIKL